jgi:hypothetical protein
MDMASALGMDATEGYWRGVAAVKRGARTDTGLAVRAGQRHHRRPGG